MSSVAKKNLYLRRLGISTVAVCISVIPALLAMPAGLAARVTWGPLVPWTGPVLLLDKLGISKHLPADPLTLAAIFGFVTLLVIAAAAIRPATCAITTAWLVVNSFWGFVLFWTFFDGMGP